MASILIGPTDRQPTRSMGEHSWAKFVGGQTVLLAGGGAILYSAQTAVASGTGGKIEFFDAASASATLDATNKVAEVNLATATAIRFGGGLVFSLGLVAKVTSGGTADAEPTVTFDQPQTVSGRTFP